MNIKIKIASIGVTLMTAMLTTGHAAPPFQKEPKGAQGASCITPSKLNVSYQDVLDLDKTNPNEIIQYGEGQHQYGELRLPKLKSATKPPLVILVHGGCWLSAFDVSHIAPAASALTSAGYAVFSLEYRRSGNEGGGWPNTLDDVLAGINAVTTADEAQYDNQNISIVGHSAGGHLALLAGATLRDSNAIKSVIGLAAITDLVSYAKGNNSCQKATSQFMGGTPIDIPQAYLDASPIRADLHPNTTLLQASMDTIVEQDQTLPNQQSILIQGAGHFDMIHPQTSSFKTLLKQLAKDL